MEKEELKRKGSHAPYERKQTDKAIKRGGSGEEGFNLQSNNGIEGRSEQLRSSSAVQQLRNDNAHEGIQEYRSENHRHIYQNRSQSFDEQRDLYTERALNDHAEPPVPYTGQPVSVSSYDYQKQIAVEEEDAQEFRRYIKEDSEVLSHNASNAAADSIFSSPDKELAKATDYLPEDAGKYARERSHLNTMQARNREKIRDLEEKKLDYRISYKPWKHRLVLRDSLSDRLKTENFHKDHIFTKDHIHKVNYTKIGGRLQFRSEKIARTENAHNRRHRSTDRRHDARDFTLRRAGRLARRYVNGAEFDEDEVSRELTRYGRRGAFAARGLRRDMRRNIRSVQREFDEYGRLRFQKAKRDALNAKQQRLNYRSGIDLQKRKTDEQIRQGLIAAERKRKLKKEMVQEYKREQGHFIARTRRQHQLKKTTRKEQKMAKKRVKTLAASLIALVSIFLIFIIILMLAATVLIEIGVGTYSNSTSQNSYGDMTEVTEYFRGLEAELEERIKPENLEPEILEENPDIYEFIYDMAEISFDANWLVAYLSAKYNEFDLEMAKEDLDEIFEEYYTLSWEIVMEDREIPDETQTQDPITGEYPLVTKSVPICYVTLEKADFYELLQSRIDDHNKQSQMDVFIITGNGQQVYGPVMNVDWRYKISSNFGNRVHPITGEVKFHDGIDIAIPVGTPLYSAVKGTVSKSYYSESTGNLITIVNDRGYEVTFMHMDSRAVSAGEAVEQGQYVGTSGNTGLSTGPHLHMRVHDAEGNKLNPIFIIPFSTDEASENG